MLWKSVHTSDIASDAHPPVTWTDRGGGGVRGDWAWVSSLAQHVVVLANRYMYILLCKYNMGSVHVIELVCPDHKCAHAQPLSPH